MELNKEKIIHQAMKF